MQELVAIDLPGGPDFVTVLTAVWDDGDAAFVVDQRLPAAAKADLLERAGVHAVVSDPHNHRIEQARHAARVEPGDALVVATSGSSGEPSLIVHTHDSIGAHAAAVHTRLQVDPRTDRWLACLPLSHLGGLGVVLRSLAAGTAVDVWPRPDLERLQTAPTDLGSTLVSLVPTVLDRVDCSGFRQVVLGGSADPAHRGLNVVRTYGLTETGGGVVYDGAPLDGVEVRCDDAGMVRLRSPTMARGRRSADGTVSPVVDADGWLVTGDLGRWDDGRLQIVGRVDDLIITGGENVWPGPVEAVLARHPEVTEVAVVGRTDPDWGQRVVAVVTPRDLAAPPNLDDLRDLVKAELPAHAAPRQLVLVDVLPRTALGKIRRRLLEEPDSLG